jgi:DNA-binding response OmpR family regulator
LPKAEKEVLKLGTFTINSKDRSFVRDGESIELKNKEFDLTAFLFRNGGRPLSRNHILESVWERGPAS